MTLSLLVAVAVMCSQSVSRAATKAETPDKPFEIHDRLHELLSPYKPNDQVALTLDACAGRFHQDLIEFLIGNRIPSTFFPTNRWLDRNTFDGATSSRRAVAERLRHVHDGEPA